MAVPYAGRRTIRRGSRKAGGETRESAEWCLSRSLSCRCAAGRSGTSGRPNPLSGGKHKLIHVCLRWARTVPAPAVLTFAGRHVDALAIPAQRVRPPEGPGHVVEHGVVGPAEAAVVLVGVKPQPPVVALHFVHLRRTETQFESARRWEIQKKVAAIAQVLRS